MGLKNEKHFFFEKLLSGFTTVNLRLRKFTTIYNRVRQKNHGFLIVNLDGSKTPGKFQNYKWTTWPWSLGLKVAFLYTIRSRGDLGPEKKSIKLFKNTMVSYIMKLGASKTNGKTNFPQNGFFINN